MKWNIAAFVSMSALLLCSDANAVTAFPAPPSAPKLSGKYIVSDTYYCQPNIAVHYDAQVFKSQIGGIGLGGPENGDALIQIAAGTLTFNASTMKVSGSLVSETGTAEIIFSTAGDGSGNNTQGVPFSQSSGGIGKSSFSASPTSVTMLGVSYSAFYGNISGGIIGYALLVGLDGQGCASRLELTHV